MGNNSIYLAGLIGGLTSLGEVLGWGQHTCLHEACRGVGAAAVVVVTVSWSASLTLLISVKSRSPPRLYHFIVQYEQVSSPPTIVLKSFRSFLQNAAAISLECWPSRIQQPEALAYFRAACVAPERSVRRPPVCLCSRATRGLREEQAYTARRVPRGSSVSTAGMVRTGHPPSIASGQAR